jgi:hypothetical protein
MTYEYWCQNAATSIDWKLEQKGRENQHWVDKYWPQIPANDSQGNTTAPRIAYHDFILCPGRKEPPNLAAKELYCF